MPYEEDTSLYPLDGNPLRFGTDEIHGHLPVESAQGLLAHRLQGSFHGAFTESGDEQGTIYQRFNFKTRRGYQCFSMNAPITAPMKHFDDAGGDTDSGFVHFFKDYAPTVMQRFHNLGWPASKLAQYYVGDELACGVKCWKFDTRKKPVSGSVGAIYWIDPSNGLCLKQQATDGSGFEVFIYDLKYQEWTIDLYPEAFLDK